MSMVFFRQDGLFPARRRALGRLFGGLIERKREASGCSVGEIASLAGMAWSEWAAIEAGHVPGDPAQLRSMAAALELSYDQMARLAWICRDDWDL
jgi:transcriptional regulator with XRE-family HTH domain